MRGFRSRLRQKRWRWALLGTVLSLGAPAGLWVVEELTQGHLSSMAWVYWYDLVGTWIVFTSFGYMAGRSMETIEHLSFYDALTGVFNRRYVLEQLQEALAMSLRYNWPLSVLMLDLDHFKAVNDTYGHLIGDQTLRAVGQVLRHQSRETDTVGRYGGEEFLIVCLNTDVQEVSRLAERIRQAIETIVPGDLGHPGPQTISIGGHSQTPLLGCNIRDILFSADQALYEAKRQGRNRVILDTK